MRTRTAMFGVVGLCGLILLSYLLLMTGCSHSTTVTPPPPPVLTQSAFFSWSAVSNSFPNCAPGYSGVGAAKVINAQAYAAATQAVASTALPCNDYLTIFDKTTGVVVTQPGIGTVSYTLTPAPAGALHQYVLYIHLINPDGSASDSEQTLAVQTIP